MEERKKVGLFVSDYRSELYNLRIEYIDGNKVLFVKSGIFGKWNKIINIPNEFIEGPYKLFNFGKDRGMDFYIFWMDTDGNLYTHRHKSVNEEMRRLRVQLNNVIRERDALLRQLRDSRNEFRLEKELLRRSKIYGELRKNLYSTYDYSALAKYPYRRIGLPPELASGGGVEE